MTTECVKTEQDFVVNDALTLSMESQDYIIILVRNGQRLILPHYDCEDFNSNDLIERVYWQGMLC